MGNHSKGHLSSRASCRISWGLCCSYIAVWIFLLPSPSSLIPAKSCSQDHPSSKPAHQSVSEFASQRSQPTITCISRNGFTLFWLGCLWTVIYLMVCHETKQLADKYRVEHTFLDLLRSVATLLRLICHLPSHRPVHGTAMNIGTVHVLSKYFYSFSFFIF